MCSDMGLNTVRLEGRIDHEDFFNKADKLGILIMPGWTCCDAWERWKVWKEDQHKIAGDSLRSQIRILRNHPSVFVWLYGSDGPPPADVEKMYLGILKDLDWPNPSISSASADPTTVTGASGVKMTGPYEYVPPMYWLADTQAGGAYGYNTETSPGPAIPPKESLERFIPKDHLWPIDDVWNFHAGGERFTTVNVFTDGLTKRYGAPTSLDDYERKAQAMTYDGQRAMFEAYGRNKYVATGVVQWMLNNAWPSLIWHLYDYYMVPAGGYYGTKKSTEIVHVQYSYDDNSVAVVNGEYEEIKGVKVSAKIYDIDAKEKGSHDATIDLAADSATKAFDLPKIDGLSKTYFLKLRAARRARKIAERQFLLALDQAGHDGLEAQEGHRVHAASGVRRLDRAEFVAAGEARHFEAGAGQEERRKLDVADDREQGRRRRVHDSSASDKRKRRRRRYADHLERQLFFVAAGRTG